MTRSTRIRGLQVTDVRFPTGESRIGSDAVHTDPDYSAAYLKLLTDDPQVSRARSLVFTLGRGTEVVAAAIESLRPRVVGAELGDRLADLAGFVRHVTGDSQLRWLGPEKGVERMAAGAVVNAAWDLFARRRGQPVWRLIAHARTEELVDLVDFTWLTDALTPDEAGAILDESAAGVDARLDRVTREGIAAYSTSAGWLGYDDDTIRTAAAAAVGAGFDLLKLKVGGDIDNDVRRLSLLRETVGPQVQIAVDANQQWEVGEAIDAIRALVAVTELAWVEEPTSPDDVLGYAQIARAVAPIRLAAGEHIANRVLFKQFLATGSLGLAQIDACRVGGVNENLAIMLLAAKHGVPVVPHAGGVGLCEMVQHLAFADAVRIGGDHGSRRIEYVDHLHEHFADPPRVERGRYLAPTAAGFSTEMRRASLHRYRHHAGAA